jgi:hypothetical protein
MIDFILENWAVLVLGLLAFIDLIVSLTPSTKDDQVVGYIRVIIETITNRKFRR